MGSASVVNIQRCIMKKEELFFAMSEETNEFLDDSSPRLSCVNSNNDDEGCYIFLGDTSTTTANIVRRVKSTPNLLQIPSPARNRKKSDDSAVGSAEESESDKSSPDNSPCDTRSNPKASSFRPVVKCLTPDCESAPASVHSFENRPLLRPPSVVVSDHDLSQHGEETYLTLDDLEIEFNQSLYKRRFSDSSTCSSLSFSELEFHVGPTDYEEEAEESSSSSSKTSKWRTLRTIVRTPFIQTYKKQRYPWVQLAGHQGNFKPGCEQGTILKKFCARERDAFLCLANDVLKGFVPQYYGVVNDKEGNEFIQLEDLLGQYRNPCVMDCKIGVRTYLEEELMKAKEKPKLRKDMYEKMLQIDPNAPSPEEHQVRGVTKPRYMVWRETISTTATMGFRIEGIKKSDGTSSKDFKTVKSEEKVKEAFNSFVDGYSDAIQCYLERLYALRDALSQSQFFATHEVIGSSLLFVHDPLGASVWMIDFAKTTPLPEECPKISHDKPWTLGDHEDGYLIGLNNLIKIFESISKT